MIILENVFATANSSDEGQAGGMDLAWDNDNPSPISPLISKKQTRAGQLVYNSSRAADSAIIQAQDRYLVT